MIREVIQAVSYLHSRNPPIVHRDIKPENILLDKNNRIKLAGKTFKDSDFGWSNFLNKPRKTYCGTFDYLAPEMIDKSGHDDKLDIWCLGVLAYELLTGKTPFVVLTPKNELKKIEVKKIIEQNILDVNISFPNDFPIMAKSFILGMVKRKPEERMTLKDIMNH